MTRRDLKPEVYAPRRETGGMVAVKEKGPAEQYSKGVKAKPWKAAKKSR